MITNDKLMSALPVIRELLMSGEIRLITNDPWLIKTNKRIIDWKKDISEEAKFRRRMHQRRLRLNEKLNLSSKHENINQKPKRTGPGWRQPPRPLTATKTMKNAYTFCTAMVAAIQLLTAIQAQAQVPPPVTNTIHVHMIGYFTNSFGAGTNDDPDNTFSAQVAFYPDGTVATLYPQYDNYDNYIRTDYATNYFATQWNNSDNSEIWFARAYWNRSSNCVTTISNIWASNDPLFLYFTNTPGTTTIGLNGSTNLSTLTNLPVVLDCGEVGPPISAFFEVKAPTNYDSTAILLYSYILTTNRWHVTPNYNGQYYGSSVSLGQSFGPNWWRTSNSTYDPAWRIRWSQSGHYISTNQSANW